MSQKKKEGRKQQRIGFFARKAGRGEKGEKERKKDRKLEKKGKDWGKRGSVQSRFLERDRRLENKDREFWEKLGEWECNIFMSETWLQRKGWEKIKR